jgi:hypothetical protein
MMSIDEKNRLMSLVEELPIGHARFFELSDGTTLLLNKRK